MQLFLHGLDDKIRVMNVEPQMEISEWRVAVSQEVGVPISHFYLYHQIKILQDGQTFADYQAKENDTVYMGIVLVRSKGLHERPTTE